MRQTIHAFNVSYNNILLLLKKKKFYSSSYIYMYKIIYIQIEKIKYFHRKTTKLLNNIFKNSLHQINIKRIIIFIMNIIFVKGKT